jgi:hypothetical protein
MKVSRMNQLYRGITEGLDCIHRTSKGSNVPSEIKTKPLQLVKLQRLVLLESLGSLGTAG